MSPGTRSTLDRNISEIDKYIRPTTVKSVEEPKPKITLEHLLYFNFDQTWLFSLQYLRLDISHIKQDLMEIR